MNFQESVAYLYGLGNEILAIKLGLDAIRTLASEFGNPQEQYPAVHIAGTNGKGSTAAFTDTILRSSGIFTGLYTSPHLESATERIVIDGRKIQEWEFARLATRVREAGERLVEKGRLESQPTFFEQVTMIAFLHFAERGVDIAVIEVGMGGRLDATNICLPRVTAITQVGRDHQRQLGNTLREIAGEKAGIIKKGVPVVVAPMESDAIEAITARAAELSAPVVSVDTEVRSSDLFNIEIATDLDAITHLGKCHLQYRSKIGEYNAWVNLRGRHQVINALTAIHIVEQLKFTGITIHTNAVNQGLSTAFWPGRLEIIQKLSDSQPILLDGAHNSAGILTLRAFLDEHFKEVPITMIFGTMKEKDVDEMAAILFPAADRLILTRIDNPRTSDPNEIAETARYLGLEPLIAKKSDEALEVAYRITEPDGLIVVCGSLYLVGEVKKLNAEAAEERRGLNAEAAEERRD